MVEEMNYELTNFEKVDRIDLYANIQNIFLGLGEKRRTYSFTNFID